MIEDALVIMPAFNEEQAIGAALRELRRVARHVLVVDDGSTDATAAIAREAGARVLHHATNLNYGGALQSGFRYGLRRTAFPYFITFDADGQHDPAALPALLAPLRAGQADYGLGSRFLSGPPAGVPAARDLGIRMFARATSWLLGRSVTDPTTGLTACTREVAQVFCLDLYPQDYPDADVIIMLSRMGFNLAEVPAAARAPGRDAGRSMHAGLARPLYYLYKMSLSMLNYWTRSDLREKRKEARLAA
jgi:glycosyltransferase involved in cell wall biosynthesis